MLFVILITVTCVKFSSLFATIKIHACYSAQFITITWITLPLCF